MMDVPADILSGIAAGGAVVGGVAVRFIDRIHGKGSDKKESDRERFERLILDLLAATRDNGQTLRHLRDITAEMHADHRVLETKLDQLSGRN
jgi:hypothetical protein